MINQLHNWKGPIEINGTKYNNIAEANLSNISEQIHIKLYSVHKNESSAKIQSSVTDSIESNMLKIKVKAYMTRKSSPDFDFMQKWNNDIPMPMRIMVGEKVKETRGMVYMKLHADITEERACICMSCGRALTNPVSQYFGIGPECGNHNYVNPFDSDEELKNAVEKYREQLRNITWEGWIIKSAIEMEETL